MPSTDDASGSCSSFRITTNSGRLCDHFSGSEFRCPCCSRIFVALELVEALDRFRGIVEGPVIVGSGYRCPVHNLDQDGSPRSLHTLGLAADVIATRLSVTDLERLAYQEWFVRGVGGIGFYPGHVHLDVGRKREWDRRT